MSSSKEPHLVVDVFAGPGGLGEGFLAHRDSREIRFKSALSIEKDDSAHETLTLRHFLRAFPDDEFPEGYYDYLAGKLTLGRYPRYRPRRGQAPGEGSPHDRCAGEYRGCVIGRTPP